MADPWFGLTARSGTVTTTSRTDFTANFGRQTALRIAGESCSASAIDFDVGPVTWGEFDLGTALVGESDRKHPTRWWR